MESTVFHILLHMMCHPNANDANVVVLPFVKNNRVYLYFTFYLQFMKIISHSSPFSTFIQMLDLNGVSLILNYLKILHK